MPRLSTHVLDTMLGRPAGGMRVVLRRLSADGASAVITEVLTNAEGRTDGPLIPAEAFTPGVYELAFHVGDYFKALGIVLPEPAFLDVVPVRVGLADTDAHYHVPLLVSPWAYSTYRGS